MEVMHVSKHVDVRPVSTVEIMPGNVVMLLKGEYKSHYPHDPGLAAVVGPPAAVRPSDAVGLLGVVGLPWAAVVQVEPGHLVSCQSLIVQPCADLACVPVLGPGNRGQPPV